MAISEEDMSFKVDVIKNCRMALRLSELSTRPTYLNTINVIRKWCGSGGLLGLASLYPTYVI